MKDYTLDLDSTRWPLLVGTYRGELPLEPYRAHLEKMIALAESRGTPFVFIVDSDVQRFGAEHRRVSVEHMKAHEAFLKARMLAVALVTRSALQRGLVTAISWVYAPPYPFKPFASVDEAATWGRAIVRDGGLVEGTG